MRIDVKFVELEKAILFAEIGEDIKSFTCGIDASYQPVITYDVPPYEGDYDITPASSVQTLETNGLRMTDDLVVEGIPYYETTNPSGGYTVIIGG